MAARRIAVIGHVEHVTLGIRILRRGGVELSLEQACRRAGPYGAAVLRGIDPFETQANLLLPHSV